MLGVFTELNVTNVTTDTTLKAAKSDQLNFNEIVVAFDIGKTTSTTQHEVMSSCWV